MRKKLDKSYYMVILIYFIVRLLILLKENNFSLAYFFQHELLGAIGYVLGVTLFYLHAKKSS